MRRGSGIACDRRMLIDANRKRRMLIDAKTWLCVYLITRNAKKGQKGNAHNYFSKCTVASCKTEFNQMTDREAS
jgi:hypothetical protein